MGGGVLFLYALYIVPALLYFRHLSESSITPQVQKGIESWQNRSKVNIYLLDFVLPRDFRRQQKAKSKHIFEKWVQIVQVSLALLAYLCRVHLVQVCTLCAILLTLARLDKIPPDALPFCPPYCFVFGALLANMALFCVFRAFLARFGAFVWVCVACVLCVACVGFCARVELGG